MFVSIWGMLFMRDFYRIEGKRIDNFTEDWAEEINQKDEYRSARKKNKKDFNIYKKNTIKSLNEVEHFLRDFNHFMKYVKLYKILK